MPGIITQGFGDGGSGSGSGSASGVVASSGYPAASDITAFLTGAGFDEDALTALADDIEDATAAAAEEWERRTGWKPFLASGSDTMRRFDPPGNRNSRVLQLRAGMVSVSEVRIGVVPGNAGVALVPDVNFFLEPFDAAAKRRPFERIQFLSPHRGLPGSMQITGRWGFATEMPADVWRVLVDKGAEGVVAQLLASDPDSLLQMTKKMDTEEKQQTRSDQLTAMAKKWESDFDRKARRYKRISL